jgi:hypothetical protein
VRLVLAGVDVGLVACGLSAPLRAGLRRHARACAATVALLALLVSPFFVRYRKTDRDRALAHEYTAHATSAYVFAPGWRWLDEHGEDGTVDVVGSPATYFAYPAMGPSLERRAIYVNVNRENYQVASRYPQCDTRINPSPDAWLDNLTATHVRWLLLSRYPEFSFPLEQRWAAARPDLFTLRYADPTNLIYEVRSASPTP